MGPDNRQCLIATDKSAEDTSKSGNILRQYPAMILGIFPLGQHCDNSGQMKRTNDLSL